MQIRTIDGHTARCHTRGIERDVNVFMLQDQPLAPGDFVMVHVGYAIQKVAEHEARSAWELADSIESQDTTGDA